MKRGTTATDVFYVGKEVDAIRNYITSTNSPPVRSACRFLYPLDRRTNDNQAKIKFQQVEWITLLYRLFPTWTDYPQDYPRC